MARTDTRPTLAVVGVGLIGGSLALALRHHEAVGRVIGVGRSRANLDLALERGVIDDVCDDLEAAAEAADIIVLATPVHTIAASFQRLRPVLDATKVVTDVGSVKEDICRAAAEHLGERAGRFVAGHPVAGRERSGVAAASADLFENHNVVLTPTALTDADATATIRALWEKTGATVMDMDPVVHDRVLSVTSHLPHLLAYAMVDFFASREEVSRCYDMAAGGFFDFTRTASSDPEMWRDIFLMNRKQVLEHIGQYRDTLERLGQLIESGDGEALDDVFAAAKEARSKVAERRKQ